MIHLNFGLHSSYIIFMLIMVELWWLCMKETKIQGKSVILKLNKAPSLRLYRKTFWVNRKRTANIRYNYNSLECMVGVIRKRSRFELFWFVWQYEKEVSFKDEPIVYCKLYPSPQQFFMCPIRCEKQTRALTFTSSTINFIISFMSIKP